MTPIEQKEYIIKRIHLMDSIEMSDELFKIKSEQFAEYLIDTFGFEIINKLSLFSDFTNNYWQLKFINKYDTKTKT
jgi:hypothetical protein